MVQQVLAVLLVLGLLGAALWLLRRKGVAKINMKFARRTASGRHLEIVDRIALTAHHSLHLVRVEDRTILIGVSPQGCAQLEVISGQGGAGFTPRGASVPPYGAKAPSGLKPALQGENTGE